MWQIKMAKNNALIPVWASTPCQCIVLAIVNNGVLCQLLYRLLIHKQKKGDEPMATNYETLLVTKADGITTITFNRPEKRNAMSPQLHREMFRSAHGSALRQGDSGDCA